MVFSAKGLFLTPVKWPSDLTGQAGLTPVPSAGATGPR